MKLEITSTIRIDKIVINDYLINYNFRNNRYSVLRAGSQLEAFCESKIEPIGTFKSVRRAERAIKLHLYDIVNEQISKIL